MRRLFVLLGCIAALLVAALPATANNKPTTGTRISFATTTFAADTPFYTEHGFVCVLGDSQCMSTEISANATFELYVNGVLQQSSVDVDLDRDAGTITKWQLINFPAGLPAGTYTFHGVWIKGGDTFAQATTVITFS